MDIKVLHIVGGHSENGAFKGAKILHKALLKAKIKSKILSDMFPEKQADEFNKKEIIFINKKFFYRFFNKIFVLIEKFLKWIFLHSPRETFNICYFGFDITKLKAYEEADIIHIHWLREGFISLKSLSKITKPVVWTMRDMWAFTGGPHYTLDFENFEKTIFSKMIKDYKKKNYNDNFNFVAVSKWLMHKAQQSKVFKKYNLTHIPNNIDKSGFKIIDKKSAKRFLNINTNKQIICYGSQNPQSKRKGWNIFIKSLEKLDKSKFFLLIFGNFWSHRALAEIGIEFKSLGYIKNNNVLSNIYSSSDLFVASSIQDAWPKTFAEAMLCKIPVVCFENTSISEIIEHKVDGYIAKKNNPNDLKKGIEWISRKVKYKKYLGQNAWSKIQGFDAKLISQKYIHLYKRIIQNKKMIK